MSLAPLFIAASLLCAVPYPDDHDGVNFILGVQRYDVQWHQPHFPGYPVYIAAGKVAAAVAGSAEWGLVWVSLISMAIAALALAGMAQERIGPPAAALAAVLMASPMMIQFSHKIFSEPMGLALLCLAALVINRGSGRGRWLAAGGLLGLTLGVRLSWWPMALGFLAPRDGRKNLVPLGVGVAAGVLLWLIPMIDIMGIDGLISTGASFTQGHFGQWGHTASDGALGHRIYGFIRGAAAVAGLAPGLWGHLAGAPMALAALAGLGMIFIKWKSGQGEPGPGEGALMAGGLLYVAWLFLGQNVDKARHYLPLLPMAAVALAAAGNRHRAILPAVALAMVAGAAMTTLAAGRGLPPAIRLAGWLEANAAPGAVVYCGWAERYFDLYDSRAKVYSVPRGDLLQLIAGPQLASNKISYMCDDIPGAPILGAPRAEFPSRPFDLVDRPLTLYLAPWAGQ